VQLDQRGELLSRIQTQLVREKILERGVSPIELEAIQQ
jgi:hypothetical protein